MLTTSYHCRGLKRQLHLNNTTGSIDASSNTKYGEIVTTILFNGFTETMVAYIGMHIS